MRTLIIVPVLGRPHRVAPLLESIADNTPEEHRVVFVVTRGDQAEVSAIVETGADWIVLRPNASGDYAKKINLAYRMSDDPFLFLAADDLQFHEGWLTAALEKMTEGVGVVGTNDLSNVRTMDGRHSTHSLIRREYADEYGTIDGEGILHEGYTHNFVDDELLGTARHRGVLNMALFSHVEHLHPDWKKAPRDSTYEIGRRSFSRDRMLFRVRSKLWT